MKIENNIEFSISTNSNLVKLPPPEKAGYLPLLNSLNVYPQTEDEYYYYLNEPKSSQGWLLHITIIPAQIEKLLNTIVPELLFFQTSFKIVKSENIHKAHNSGNYGTYKIGKIITVFLDNETIIQPLIKQLISKTKGFVGPQVFTDFQISNILYTRYGSFKTIIQRDFFGNRIRIIKDGVNNLIQDQYYTPPLIPQGIDNPFLPCLEDLSKAKKQFLIGNKYMPVKLLKSDSKGDVWKSLYFTRFLIPKWCVVKQGRKGMFPDNIGRDATDRITWQSKISEQINNIIQVPKIVGYFEEEGTAYISMNFINGKPFKFMVTKELENSAWFLQPVEKKVIIFDWLLQIISAIKILHEKGFVHRDITGTNFLVSKQNRVYLIDLELLYSVAENIPDPPFGVGTPGFMSPEQENELFPTPADDSYSIGALLMMVFASGIGPRYIFDNDTKRLEEKLYFWTGEPELAKLILQCFSSNPSQRPSISSIYDQVASHKTSVSIHSKKISQPLTFTSDTIENIVQQSINTLASELLSIDNLWFSHIENNYGRDVYPLGDKYFYTGLQRGCGGVIWLLSQLEQIGFDITICQTNIEAGLEYIQNEIRDNLNYINPSLYYGRAGLAVVLHKAAQSGLLQDRPEFRNQLFELFQQPSSNLNIIYGVAGQGLGLLQLYAYLESKDIYKTLVQYAGILVDSQQNDGSWVEPPTEEKKIEKVTGFGYGIAGIVYFLLEYGFNFKNRNAIKSAEKGLNYLEKTAIKNDGHFEWASSNVDKSIGKWWCNGAPGIALSFLKAYELTKQDKYCKLAEKALLLQPEYIVHHKLSQCHGLSGLGEIYLEAYRIIKNETWKQRASWIADSLLNFRKEILPGTVSWLVDQDSFPTADFMIGNSGVIHFLARYLYPEKLTFPFLPKLKLL